MVITPQESAPQERAEAASDREVRVARAFVRLADTLVADFDVAEFLHMLTEQCVELLDSTAAGVVLVDRWSVPHVTASSSQEAELLELFAVQADDGPCIDCVRSQTPVSCPDLREATTRWPRFTAAAHECGFRSAHALPLRLREHAVGAITLLNTQPGDLSQDVLQLGQALADVATIGILQQRAIEHADQLSGQLQTALGSRIVIEQAKGILAVWGEIPLDVAFSRLRGYARAHHHRLTDLAHAVTTGVADRAAILAHRAR
ncbi:MULTISPECIES: GAF and ANTAR domain-containing protein [Actinosynnema]|uniref:GAF and ANTAR domain-containing protein n=1 Tax=Actinosynnema TaxID=40566 RepID=UPI0020A4E37C|nr:GAF and ANTAR domain-containing protein [Actinosynnema pretiosum]MCP2092145.1 ANTAR domain-containing protein [Actinosynnema pretiosum]